MSHTIFGPALPGVAPTQTPMPASSATNASKMASSAKEFEAILLGQWMQSAQTSFGSLPGAEEDRDEGDDQMTSFGVQQLAKALTDAGGVGIARIVSKALTRADAHAPTVHNEASVSR